MSDADELIERLCMVAAMIMEDTAEAALIASATDGVERRLLLVSEAGRDIRIIAAAAQAISVRYGKRGAVL